VGAGGIWHVSRRTYTHVAQLSSGWWVGTNVSRGAVKHILELACEVAQVEFGRTLIVNLGD